jgi:hypothetical protein
MVRFQVLTVGRKKMTDVWHVALRSLVWKCLRLYHEDSDGGSKYL